MAGKVTPYTLPAEPRNMRFPTVEGPGPQPIKPRNTLKKVTKAPLAKPHIVKVVRAIAKAPKVAKPKAMVKVTKTLKPR